ncbi:MAG: aminotransferase class V-fold PLP-dependent enzyme [Pseudomonadota bacterium]
MTGLTSRALWEEMQSLTQNGAVFTRALEHGQAYLREAHDRRVAPTTEAVKALDAFREPMPEGMGDPYAIIDQLHRAGSPGTMAQTGGRFFGLVNGAVVPTGLAARLLADCWDQNAVLHAISPTNAVLEEVCQDWLRDLFGLPESTVAGFVSGTSMAIVCGLAAARWRLCQRAGYDVNAGGLAGVPKLRIVTGRHTHSTVMKAVALLGFGTDTIEWVEVDAQGRLDADDLPEMDDRTILILQVGNVNSGAFDPIRAACEKASAAGAWVHIDGAFGLWAAASQSLRHLTDGIELAQSWSVDGHKTLNTPYDSGISLCSDPEAMVKALQNSGAYIMYSEHRDGMLYTPEMSRRARAVDLWATLKYLGRSGVDRMVTTLHDRARQFAEELATAGFEVLNDVSFNQVLFRIGDKATTDAFLGGVQASGEAWVGGSLWNGDPVVRISVCSWATTENDVRRAVAAFEAARASAGRGVPLAGKR